MLYTEHNANWIALLFSNKYTIVCVYISFCSDKHQHDRNTRQISSRMINTDLHIKSLPRVRTTTINRAAEQKREI